MAKDHRQVIAVNDAVHKLQLAMLDGVTDQNQLFAAGTLISRSDYEDVVTERTIGKLCGYPLCRALSKLTIRENVDEIWIWSSGWVLLMPLKVMFLSIEAISKSKNGKKKDTKGSQSNQEKNTDLPSSKNDFTSTIIISDEYNVPKLPPQTKQASTTAKSEDTE